MTTTSLLGNNILLLQNNMKTKEDYINEAIRGASLLRSGIISRTTTAPPTIQSIDDAYIVPAGATGQWATHTNKIAVPSINVVGGALWKFYTPWEGLTLWSIEDNQLIVYSAGSWQNVTGIGGGGDMSKNVYDPDDDGVVVAAEVAEEIAGTPGNNQYYGTNPSGVKGFYALPTITGLGAYVVNTNTQPLVSNQAATLNFNSAITDTGGFWSSQSPTRLTIPTAGLYLVSFQCRINGNVTATQIAPFLWVNNSFAIAADQRSMTNQLAPDLFVFAIFSFNQSDYIEARIWLESTASYAIFNSTNSEPFRCCFSIARFP